MAYKTTSPARLAEIREKLAAIKIPRERTQFLDSLTAQEQGDLMAGSMVENIRKNAGKDEPAKPEK